MIKAFKFIAAALSITALTFVLWIFLEAIFELETRVTNIENSLMGNTQEVVDATPPHATI
ncbi:MAG TPA: hypothetical protein EYQ54_15190 [Myxococcales bacterium]|jgi:hypothetical protein|nr:hypothetical protein [Myxococcales bacterium]